MKLNAFLAGVLCALAAVAAATVARRVQAAEPAGSRLQLVSELPDTRVYVFKYEGATCFVASTKGGSGISLQCLR